MPVLAFLLALQVDARMEVRASLTQPRVTYAELGAWVQRSTGVPVYVVPAIRERKATVLVEGLPVRETMDRVAEGLFLEWERTPDGYTLRLQPDAAREESRYASDEASAWREGLREGLATMAEFGRYSPEGLKNRMDQALEEARSAPKDDPAASAAAWARYNRLSSAVYGPMNHAAGMVLAGLTPARREAILAGKPVFVTNRPAPGLLPAPAGLSGFENFHWPADARMIFGIEYRAGTNEITLTSLKADQGGWSSSSMGILGDASPVYEKALAEEPLRKRLAEWVAGKDPKVLATPLAVEKAIAEPPRQTTFRSLADLLVVLHRRTGLPIVADGYRPAVAADHAPDGKTVADWLKDLEPLQNRGWRGYRPNARSSGGWLMLRQPRYWKQLAREVPEGRIRALEAAVRREGGATLDDFAAFGAGLTAAQEPYVGGSDLVMEAPYQGIAGNVPFLRLWNALPSGMRREALAERGLLAATLPPAQRRLAMDCVSSSLSLSRASEPMLPYLLPGGPPLPADLRLYVKLEPVSSQAFPDQLFGEYYTYDPSQSRVDGASAALRTPAFETFAFYGVPFRPAPPANVRKANVG